MCNFNSWITTSVFISHNVACYAVLIILADLAVQNPSPVFISGDDTCQLAGEVHTDCMFYIEDSAIL